MTPQERAKNIRLHEKAREAASIISGKQVYADGMDDIDTIVMLEYVVSYILAVHTLHAAERDFREEWLSAIVSLLAERSKNRARNAISIMEFGSEDFPPP